MKITSLKYQKNDPNRVSVFLDEEYSFSLHVNNLVDWKLAEGVELDTEQIDEIVNSDLRQRIYTRAINYLARGPRSQRQIRNYLKQLLYKNLENWYRGDFDLDQQLLIDETVERLETEGYINDQEYARNYVESVSSRKAVSKVYLHSKLFEKGISKEIIDEILSNAQIDEEESARDALQKKYGNDMITYQDKKKIQFLARKGFNWEIISKLMKN